MDLDKNCRILVLWDQSRVDLQVLHKTDQLIHCKVTTKDKAWTGVFTFVYAHNTSEQRKSLCVQRFQSGIQIP